MVTVPTAKDDELASFGNFLPYYLLQPLRVPNGIGCIKYQSRFYEKRLRFRIGARTTSRARIHHKDRAAALLNLLFQRSLFRAMIG
jgi:hypothetical protein